MANTKNPNLLLFVFFCLIWAPQIIQGSRIQILKPYSHQRQRQRVCHNYASEKQELRGGGTGRKEWIDGGNARRLMIGSVAPTCTYNECRGCKFKCRAVQVPVEGNDPINSAYHYKCICQRP